jgi:hypothetical protein
MLLLNPAEIDALVRALDGLTDTNADERAASVQIDRRDSLDTPDANGHLIVRVNWRSGGWTEDAISESGSTVAWGTSR